MAFWKKIWDFFTFEDDDIEDDFLDNDVSVKPVRNNSKTVNVVIMEISGYDEAGKVTEKLSAGNGVIVNLKSVPHEERKRVIDFICGAVYALNGKIQKLQDDYFFFAPYYINFIVENNESVMEESLFSNEA